MAIVAKASREGVLMQAPATQHKKDGRVRVIAAAIITGLRLARDPRAGHKTGTVKCGDGLAGAGALARCEAHFNN
jgi:hypothetical protein